MALSNNLETYDDCRQAFAVAKERGFVRVLPRNQNGDSGPNVAYRFRQRCFKFRMLLRDENEKHGREPKSGYGNITVRLEGDYVILEQRTNVEMFDEFGNPLGDTPSLSEPESEDAEAAERLRRELGLE